MDLSATEMTSILETVVQQSHNDIIIMAIVIIIGLVVFFIPFYSLYNKSKKQASTEAANERASYLAIIQANSDAITSLKHSLEVSNEMMASTLLDVESSVNVGVAKIDKLLKKHDDFIADFIDFATDEDIAHQQYAKELAKVSRTQEKILNKMEDIGDKVSTIK